MRLYTPDSLLYPITVTKLLHKPGDEIEINTPLFVYEYKSTVKEFDPDTREDRDVQRTWPSNFESELEGKLLSLNVRVGQVLTARSHVGEVEEACQHEVQFQGICADCGKDLTLTDHYNTTVRDVSRASVNTVHGRTELLISEAVASRADEETKRRLLESKRLSLVVDLDQTIIHATVDPTVAEWQKDTSNPNHEAVKDVRAFQLADDFPGLRNTWYYIKLRPGLQQFLEEMSNYYELHIYTMGTRAYAENIAKIIDPDRKIFGDRVLSRDESGSQSAKKLSRLFPVDTKMVVIIDDRADVWHWISNLVKVPLYDFFVGIGDINGSFLPKRPTIESKPARTIPSPDENEAANAEMTTSVLNTNNGEQSVMDQIVSMAGSQDPSSLKEKSEEQDQTLAAQLEDRPLLQKQKILEAAEEEEAKASPAAEAATALLSDADPVETTHHSKYRHNLLQDDDDELEFLGQHLRRIHDAYFDKLHSQTSYGTNGIRKTSNLSAPSSIPVSLTSIPDVAQIMQDLKSHVLAGVHLVFTGVIPLGFELASFDTVCWAQTFGAYTTENITRRTTHIIASPDRRTAKVRQAAKRNRRARGSGKGRVWIVSQQWLLACFSRWERVSEQPYRIHDDTYSGAMAEDGEGGLPDGLDGDGANGRNMLMSESEDDAGRSTEDDDAGDSGDDAGIIIRPLSSVVVRSLALDTEPDTDAELEMYAPSLDRKDSSPIDTENPDQWGDIDEEFREFMGSDAEDDSDTESTTSATDGNDQERGTRTPSWTARKRKRDATENDSEVVLRANGASTSMQPDSRLQKRKRDAAARTSSLTQMVLGDDDDDDEEQVDNNDSGSTTGITTADGQDGGDGEDWDLDLEAALEAEMARQEEEDGALQDNAIV